MTDNEIRSKVRKIIHENMIAGFSESVGVNYHYTKPSPGTYPFQFFWDTCFHVFILNSLGESEMAKKHLESLFALQEEDGFVGHIIYWDKLWPGRLTDVFQSKPGLGIFKSHMSALVQPPLVAQAVLRTFQATQDKEFLVKIFEKLDKYYKWLARNRDFEGTGLLSIISPFESGMDWKPTYDPVVGFPEKKADGVLFRKVVGVDFKNFLNGYNLKTIYRKNYFIVKDVGFNTIYTINLKVMAELAGLINSKEAEYYRRQSEKVSGAIFEMMYDEETVAFLDLYGHQQTKIKILTPTIFFPVLLDEIPDSVCKQVIERHFYNKEEFDTPFPIPSVAINHPSFYPEESLYLWRGPTWIAYNWFMHKFFADKGYKEEADKLVNSIKELISKSGFREYYNPFTGEGYGAQDFTWSALVLDMMDKVEEKRLSNKVYLN